MKPLILLLCLSILPFAFGSSDSAVDSSVAPTVKKFLDIEKVKKVSYLLASGRGFGQSSFGHSYLRFSYDENKFSEDDITIEFIADAPPSELNYLRGIGIGENYNLAVVPSDYKNVYRYHVIGEDRDLTSYVLNLSNHDIRALSSKINELIANGSGMTYSFFLRNCAAMVSEVFEESLEITFNGPNSVIPVFIPHKLKKKGMIKTIHTDPRVSTLRENVVAEKLKDISVEAIEFQNIRKQLASQDFGERLLGLYKLQNYREDHYDQRPLDIKLRSLGGNIIKYESKLVKNQMRPFFSAKKDFFSAVKVDDVVVTPHVRSIKSVKFAVHGDKVYITAKLRILAHHKKDGPRKLMSAKRVLPGFRFKDGIIYNPDGEIFAYRLSTDVLDAEFYSPGVYVGAELAKVKHNKVVHFTILEENAFEPLKRNYTDRDLMAVDNGDGVKGGGYCYSHSVLNRMLKHQVIFDPTSVPLTKEQNFALIRELYRGKIVVIPGYENINQFTKSLGREELGQFISQQQKLNYGFVDFAKEWFTDTRITAKNFYILKNLIELGYSPIIKIKVEDKRNIGHSIIVTNIAEIKKGYSLEAVDPNNLEPSKNDYHKIVKNVHWFNTRTDKLHTFNYGNAEAYLPKQNINFDELITLVLSNANAVKSAIDTSKIRGIYSFHIIDLFK